ncbi:MAG: hypothetical protein K2X32_14435 [Phycisphaerales bacterium]|nr:hypothetical protein [Phycisphaerales bacterium]
MAARARTSQTVQSPARSPERQTLAALNTLLASMADFETRHAAVLRALSPPQRKSAANLLHYLVFRSQDHRQLQTRLTNLGLSSLGRSEAAILPAVKRVRDVLARLLDQPQPKSPARAGDSDAITRARATRLLGRPRKGAAARETRIMVTMPSEAATSPSLIKELLDAGMDIMRINCAHDTPDAWAKMIRNLRRFRSRSACPVLMDIPGPKARTGALRPGPAVVKVSPPMDDLGRATRPARVLLVVVADVDGASAPAPLASPTAPDVDDAEACDARLPIRLARGQRLRVGQTLRLTDARGRARRLRIVSRTSDGWLCTCARTAYITPGTHLLPHRDHAHASARAKPVAVVGDLPSGPGTITLCEGDTLILTANPAPGGPAAAGAPATIPFTLPEVFADLRRGHRVLLDDGKIEAVITRAAPDHAALRIARARPAGSRLREGKGVNFPDTPLSISPLTAEDRAHLPFIARHADMVGFSFVRRAADLQLLRECLRTLKAPDLGIVLKIETAGAFEHLPELLLESLAQLSAGVMIARGDLAVEVGWERLAEVQEEILWLCEAAHIPVIWATQVLESMAKHGLPSRSEITDAAMGQRAECVMLNKGPFVARAVRMLDDILRRMSAHQDKKRSMLRRLKVASGFDSAPEKPAITPGRSKKSR